MILPGREKGSIRGQHWDIVGLGWSVWDMSWIGIWGRRFLSHKPSSKLLSLLLAFPVLNLTFHFWTLSFLVV